MAFQLSVRPSALQPWFQPWPSSFQLDLEVGSPWSKDIEYESSSDVYVNSSAPIGYLTAFCFHDNHYFNLLGFLLL